MIDSKTPHRWTLQPRMRPSPFDGYRFEHIRSQKLSQLLTHSSLKERGFHAEICSGLTLSILHLFGQKPFGPQICKGTREVKGHVPLLVGPWAWFIPFTLHERVWFQSGISFIVKGNTAMASQEDSVTLMYVFVSVSTLFALSLKRGWGYSSEYVQSLSIASWQHTRETRISHIKVVNSWDSRWKSL